MYLQSKKSFVSNLSHRPGAGAPGYVATAAADPSGAPAVAAGGHTPGQTPIKSPEKKKTKTVEAEPPVQQEEQLHNMDSLPTMVLGDSPAESPVPTPKNLASAFETAAMVESTPQPVANTVAPSLNHFVLYVLLLSRRTKKEYIETP